MEYTFSDRVSNLKPSAIREISNMRQTPRLYHFLRATLPPMPFPQRK